MWPSTLTSPSVFGVNSFRLNQIREQHRCHIVSNQSLRCFELCSYDGEYSSTGITNAMEALKVALCESIADSTKSLKAYFIEIPAGAPSDSVISLVPSKLLEPSLRPAGVDDSKRSETSGHTEIVARLRDMPRHLGTAIGIGHIESTNKKNHRIMDLAITQSLGKLQYRRGRIQIRALIGVFVFTRYLTSRVSKTSQKQNLEPMHIFVDSLKHPRTQGALYRL